MLGCARQVYALSRASPKAVRAMVGMDRAPAWLLSDAVLCGSNVYSPAESVLLSWVTHHFQQARAGSTGAASPPCPAPLAPLPPPVPRWAPAAASAAGGSAYDPIP